MDLRVYYEQIRELEREIASSDAVVMSLATRDGGKPGVLKEVPRGLAAKLIVDGKARLSTAEEEAQFRADLEEGRRRAAGNSAPLYSTGRVQVAVLPESPQKNPNKRG